MNNENKIIITPLNIDLIEDINKTNDCFKLYGRVVPSLQSGKWSYKEILFEEIRETRFPDDKLDWSQYINREDKALFLAYMNNTCIGQIRIMKDWNRFCYIENIATKKDYRGNGIGKLLLNKAEEWAKQRNLIGMSLEAQDDNLGACRFYVKQGFILGGADTLKQSYNPIIETTLYWYKLFK
ncbi:MULTISPECIES: GNAT family N-acetyltransferase [unclassified Bacillus (in: firmicutes)]|uniref:GNAT family N-acetyltransferase n=1 Tax=unclassified Bacillus (in: firmicutes) TaxID=185979 RepID=UPI0004E16312|nr:MULTISPECIES: GNAT family N-acetyltransferase [unclassified Bacillus (in: firmicutes)]CAI9391054.1 Streptothricin acetyltransferase A [Bacillus sp. T2.9-1]